MRSRLQNSSIASIVVLFLILFSASTAFAQTTSFTYQGRLTDGGTAANGNYDLQFALWTSLSGGSQVGSTQTMNAVAVSNGVFTVSLDFGANAFPGASRFVEISARTAGSGSFTLLSPRQPITSTPYAVRSLNAASADSVPASGVPAGSGNYIQNTSSPQSANFNISGSATAGGTVSGGVLNATTQYNLNGSRILSNAGSSNLLAGVGSGQSNTGQFNSFFGSNAGNANTSGGQNAFFGSQAGRINTTGSFNAFVGHSAGSVNTTGDQNSFFGAQTGQSNTTGGSNSFFGTGTGAGITTGTGNTFIGAGAGSTIGTNAIGTNNTLLGARTDVTSGVNDSTAIGFQAQVTQSNSLVLGSFSTSVGIGTTAPHARLHIRANGGNILLGDAGCGAGFGSIGFGSSGCGNYAFLGGDGNTYINRPANGTIIFRESNGPNQVEIRPGGTVGIAMLGTGGSTQLCRNGAAAISTCSSSLRYKTDVKPFGGGLQLINRLQPVIFNWKATHRPDIGLIAEEVAKVEPRLAFKNESGEIEGVNYSQLTAVLINAVKQQQAQIQKQTAMLERQQALVNRQQQQLDALKKLACRSNPRANVCKKFGVR
jgi:Chaperone of endosialidase